MRDEHGIIILYITHGLVATYFTDRAALMYLGSIVEIGPTGTLLSEPRHPYAGTLV